MDFIEIVNQLGKIAGKLSFEPIWKPYEGDKPVWIACEGLTLKDARVGYKWCESLLQIAEVPYTTKEAWDAETPEKWEQLVSDPFKGGFVNLLTLGAPLFRFAYFGSPKSAFKDHSLDSAYKILCYSSNFSHNAVAEDKSKTEPELVQIRKKQKRMLWQNAGDFDLQLVLELTEGMSLDLAAAKEE